jgi:hypothetical protein
MRLGSSTSLSRLAPPLLALIALVAIGVRSGAVSSFGLCLPPAVDDGERLQEVGTMRLAHLALALRQHRVCRSPDPGDGPRVFLFGNSTVLGHPLPVQQTFAAELSRRFAPSQARIFNLGTLFTYQVKDAVVLDAALRYRPDAVIWGIALNDFNHTAPILWPDGMVEFFAVNSARVRELAANPPAGLAEPFARYAVHFEGQPPKPAAWLLLRSLGNYVQLAVGHASRALLERHLLDPADVPAPSIDPTHTPFLVRPDRYDCATVEADFARQYSGWPSWNVLMWLEQLSRERDIPILVVQLPVVHQPIGGCYNAHYPTASFRKYLAWLGAETRARGLAFVDLHDLLPESEFLDSLHPSAAGHQRVAAALAPAVAALTRAPAPRP